MLAAQQRRPTIRKETVSGHGYAWRGRGRCFGKRLRRKIGANGQAKARRDCQCEILWSGRKFKGFDVRGGFAFLLRLFPGRDGFAERAGVLAVESARDRLREGVMAQIIGQHGSPGHRLEENPVQPNGTGQRQHENKFGQPRQHRSKARRKESPLSRPRIGKLEFSAKRGWSY